MPVSAARSGTTNPVTPRTTSGCPIGRWNCPVPTLIHISRALVFCDRLFDFGFTGGRKVIDVSGDGDDNQGIFGVREVRDALVAKGVVINGLPIIVKPPQYIFPPQPPEGLEVYYRRNVVGGDGHVVIESIGFDNFKQAILQKLLLEIG